jgi:hypothetical protein
LHHPPAVLAVNDNPHLTCFLKAAIAVIGNPIDPVARLGVLWMASLLSVASLAAATDLRVVDATEKGDKEAALLC